MSNFDLQIAQAFRRVESTHPAVRPHGCFQFSSCFDLSGLALSTLSAAAIELAKLIGTKEVSIDRRLTECWFDMTLRPTGWRVPDPWNPIAGNYRARDGWILLHTNVPAHRSAALSVLQVMADKEKVATEVGKWNKLELQNAIVDAGGVAGAMQSLSDWELHPQGVAVASEPLIIWSEHQNPATSVPALGDRLEGLRVLDLTRVLAGPVSTRFLAGFGAKVLRVDPPDWNEAGLEPEITLGKACCELDLRRSEDRSRFETLLSQAHVLVHGYRPGALEALGYGEANRLKLNPDLIDVSLSAYGWSGPWKHKRGFDSIVQMNAGIAHQGMVQSGADNPVPLPVQALDHATGYLMAASVLHAIRQQRETGRTLSARLSLARVAHLLVSGGIDNRQKQTDSDVDVEDIFEATHWGTARRVVFPAELDGRGPTWNTPACPFRSSPPEWPGDGS